MKAISKALALLLLFSCTACAPHSSPNQSSQVSSQGSSSTSLQISEPIQHICEEAETVICDYWNQLSTVNNSEISVDSINEDGDLLTVEFSVTVDRTFTTPPEEMPDIVGLQRAVDELADPADKEIAQRELDGQLAERQSEYMTTVEDDRYALRAEIHNIGTEDETYTIYCFRNFGQEELKYELNQYFSEEMVSSEKLEQMWYDRVHQIVAQASKK